MSNQKNFGAGFSALPDTNQLKTLTISSDNSDKSFTLENLPGKQASVKILYAISQDNNSKISSEQAKVGLALFGDYTEEEKQQPNTHPNIRFLMDVIANDELWMVEAE